MSTEPRIEAIPHGRLEPHELAQHREKLFARRDELDGMRIRSDKLWSDAEWTDELEEEYRLVVADIIRINRLLEQTDWSPEEAAEIEGLVDEAMDDGFRLDLTDIDSAEFVEFEVSNDREKVRVAVVLTAEQFRQAVSGEEGGG